MKWCMSEYCNWGWPGETLAAWLLMAPQSLAIPLPPPPSCHLCPLLPLEHDDCVHGGGSARKENKIEREEGESWTVCWFNCNVCSIYSTLTLSSECMAWWRNQTVQLNFCFHQDEDLWPGVKSEKLKCNTIHLFLLCSTYGSFLSLILW